jgi:prepilin-type processing-associated H-X9-DG protein
MKRMWFALPVVCLLLIAASLPAAEPLAERLPSGTLLYVGWSGKTKALDESRLGKLLQEPGFGRMVDMIRVAASASGGPRDMIDGGWDLATTALRHPIAVALVGLEAGPDGPPDISAALLIDLGADRKDFAAKLDALIEKAGMKLEEASEGELKYRQLPTPIGPFATGYLGDTLFVCVGKDMAKRLAAVTPAKSLASDAGFADAMKAVAGPDLILAVYADAAGLLMRSEILADSPQAPPSGRAPSETPRGTDLGQAPEGKGHAIAKVVQALGVANLKTLAGTICVTDGYLHSKMRIATPAPHKGVFFPLAGEALTDADLAFLPDDTDLLGAAKFSADGLYDEVRRIIRELSPDTDAEITRELANPKGLLSGLAVKELLGSLGQTWTISCAQSYGGLLSGTLLTADVKDAAKFSSAVARLEALLKPPASASAPAADSDSPFGRPRGGPALRVLKTGEVEIHYVSFSGMPIPVAPAWAVYKGRLYVAAWPQVILSALDNQGKAPLVKNADFAQLRARLGGGPSIITYFNASRFLRMGYGLPLALWTAGSGMIPGEGPQVALPEWLPPLSVFEKCIRPAISASSSDKDGITLEGYSTFPGIGISPLSPAVSVAVLMPALSKARFQARKASSMANLSMIGKAVALYSANHKDQYPPDFDALVEDKDATPANFVSSLSGRAPPKVVDKKLIGEVDYIYVQGVGSDAPSDLVLAYERPENHNGEGTNVLYADLHVGHVDMFSFQESLKKTQEYLKKKTEK